MSLELGKVLSTLVLYYTVQQNDPLTKTNKKQKKKKYFYILKSNLSLTDHTNLWTEPLPAADQGGNHIITLIKYNGAQFKNQPYKFVDVLNMPKYLLLKYKFKKEPITFLLVKLIKPLFYHNKMYTKL